MFCSFLHVVSMNILSTGKLHRMISRSYITANIILTRQSTKRRGRQPMHVMMKTRQQHTACLILCDNPRPSDITAWVSDVGRLLI